MSRQLKFDLRYQRDGPGGVETLIERGVTYEGLPDWYRDEPVLESWDQFYTTAFWRLSTMRSIGFSMGPIPHCEIEDYAEKRELKGGMMLLFEAVMRGMDDVYMTWSNKQQTKARKSNSQPQIIQQGNKTKSPKPRS